MLPDSFHAVAEVIDDVAPCCPMAGWQEAADDAGDVVTQVKLLRLVHALTFHTEAEAPDFWNHYGVAVRELHLQRVLQVGYYCLYC